MKQLFTICVTCTATEVQRARELSFEWIKSRRPATKQTVGEMLPTALTAIGGDEITRYLCSMTLTEGDFMRMQAFIGERGVPVVAESAGPQEDSLASRNANRDAWLAAKGLAVANA